LALEKFVVIVKLGWGLGMVLFLILESSPNNLSFTRWS